MRKKLVATLVAVLALSAVAVAQPSGNDIMGIYFDPDATQFCSEQQANSALTFYLLLVNPTGAQITAWECKVEWDQLDGGFFGNWTFANDGINVGDTSDPLNTLLAVGVGANPIQTQPVTLLATWSGFWGSGTEGSVFKVQPYPGTASFDPPAPGYAVNDVDSVPCGVPSGDFDLPVARITQTCGLPAETSSWSGVKALYH